MRPQSNLRTIALTIAGTVGAAIILSMVSSLWNLATDVQRLKDEQVFYHGAVWPPPAGGAPHP